jgi:cell division protein FtsQ
MDTPRKWNRQPFRVPTPPGELKENQGSAGEEQPKKKIKKRRYFHFPSLHLSPRLSGALLGLIVAFAVISFLIHRPWFHFGHVRVLNASTITTEEVMEKAGISEPVNIFTIDRRGLEKMLKEDIRVEKVSVSFGFPNFLDVDITEREPGIYLECDGPQYAKVSFSGHVLDVTKGIPDAKAPFVTGYRAGNLMTGDELEDENLKGLLTFLNRLDPQLRDRISEISLDDRMHIKIHLENGIPIIVGDYENALAKIDTFTMLCKKLEAKKIKARYIDLTFDKPYIKLN